MRGILGNERLWKAGSGQEALLIKQSDNYVSAEEQGSANSCALPAPGDFLRESREEIIFKARCLRLHIRVQFETGNSMLTAWGGGSSGAVAHHFQQHCRHELNLSGRARCSICLNPGICPQGPTLQIYLENDLMETSKSSPGQDYTHLPRGSGVRAPSCTIGAAFMHSLCPSFLHTH